MSSTNPILTALKEGRLVPFLGWDAGCIGRPAADSWVQGQYMPCTTEAAQALAQSLTGAVEGVPSLPQISQYISLLHGEGALYDRLGELYGGDYPPTLLHRLLAELPDRWGKKGYPSDRDRRFVIFSTAFDYLLERAFAAVEQPYHLFAYRPRFEDTNGIVQTGRFVHVPPGGEAVEILSPNEYAGHEGDHHPVIVKLSGRAFVPEPDGIMVTEDQYLANLSAQENGTLLPTRLLAGLKRRSFLFVGYSLQPWQQRLLWQRLRPKGSRPTDLSWALVTAPTDIEREFWRSQGIVPIEATPVGLVAYVNEWLQSLAVRP